MGVTSNLNEWKSKFFVEYIIFGPKNRYPFNGMFLWLGFPSLPLLISAQKERREQHLQGVYSTFSHPSLHLRCHFEFFNFLYLMPTFTTSKNQQHPSIELYVEMDSMSDFEMSKLCVFQESTVMVVRWHSSGIQNNGDSEEATLLWFMFSVWKQGGVQWRRRQRSSQGGKLWPRLFVRDKKATHAANSFNCLFYTTWRQRQEEREQEARIEVSPWFPSSADEQVSAEGSCQRELGM